ncbi:MAG: succinate dehydrogenase, hydrophobic membrane anchor protein [Candidatus Liberibacter europaeus]|uniref:Succinate dehydrogenase hydrophobic membrane anchor subunit n=1 Tax=Candidatus Liberibacter europaeus TaxID=744859 RepID=A0A2T4VWA4_9HYPH|nr:succinate dehydrogenase, hydrophobic membrane anchor protein [Candidatus Liberibacter europaeus]PTL86043.1 MAG: succinate dehydrogenase, hydrophobic membrane anchor protein [Candidatus Liberibacter europaeus]
MGLRSSLGKVRGMGSSKSGTDHFLTQRITAIANIPCITFFVVFFMIYGSSPYENIIKVTSNLFVASIMIVGIISAAIHMQLGMQVVIEDYVHSKFLKIVFIVFNNFFVIFSAILCLISILKIAMVGNL